MDEVLNRVLQKILDRGGAGKRGRDKVTELDFVPDTSEVLETFS